MDRACSFSLVPVLGRIFCLFLPSECLFLAGLFYFFGLFSIQCRVLYPYKDSRFGRSYCSERDLLLTK